VDLCTRGHKLNEMMNDLLVMYPKKDIKVYGMTESLEKPVMIPLINGISGTLQKPINVSELTNIFCTID